MKAIEEAITRLEQERSAFNAKIDGKIEGLKESLRIIRKEPEKEIESSAQTEDLRRRQRRGNLKETVIDLLEESAEKGLTTEECISNAKSTKSIELVPGSVSSLLSRLKQLDVVFFDGSRYRLKKYQWPRHVA